VSDRVLEWAALVNVLIIMSSEHSPKFRSQIQFWDGYPVTHNITYWGS
jgi:hypothetical protein